LVRLRRFRERFVYSLGFETRPDLSLIRSHAQSRLNHYFAQEDSSSKRAVLIGNSGALADALGLKAAIRLVLPYPDFTVENLALLSDEYDFVIADRVLHRCTNLDDAARETLRVLKPGGRFVHTVGAFDFMLGANVDPRRLAAGGLHRLFGDTQAVAEVRTGGNVAAIWIAGRKATSAPKLVPSVATRKASRPYYRFRPRKAKFGMMAMVRNEAPYLLEWIAYHRLLGFEQFTIYDNGSNDASARMLSRLAGAGIVNALYWSDRRSKQLRAYNHAVRRLRPFVEWCLFADIDEYLELDPGFNLEQILPRDPDVMGVSIPWLIYGSAGIRNRENGLTIERFTKAAKGYDPHVKSIVRLKDIERMGVHIPTHIRGRLVDISGREIVKRGRSTLSWTTSGPARINHYFTRSWEEFECKRARGRGAFPGLFRGKGWFEHFGHGEVDRRRILEIVPALRDEIMRLRRIVE
jgi:SAM-dependent methyltransferase